LFEFVGQLLVVGDEVGHVDVAVILLHQHVLPNLISADWLIVQGSRRATCTPVDEDIVQVEVHDKIY
jgi:hypothetical protein